MCAGAGAHACVAWASGCGMGQGEVGVEGGVDCEEVEDPRKPTDMPVPQSGQKFDFGGQCTCRIRTILSEILENACASFLTILD